MAATGLVVPPGAPELPARLSATSWLVADLETGAVLGACAPHEHGIPASTQKLLLALTLLDDLDPTEDVGVTTGDLRFEPGSSAVGLLEGGTYRIETLWLGLLLNSGNDAARVLARVGGGSIGLDSTLRQMNATARWLGANQTHAATPSGLDGPGQFTSAYDLALIARQLFDRPDFLEYVATERVDIPPQPPEDPDGYEIQNQNQLLYEYDGAIGGKTGYTDLARHSYVGAAERDGRRLVVTILSAEARPVRAWRQGADLLDWGFSLPRDVEVGRLVSPGEALTASTTAAGSVPTVAQRSAAAPGPPPTPVWLMPATLAAAAVGATAVVLLLLMLLARRWLRRG